MREILHIVRGYLWWKLLCIKYAINYNKVVLVLANENEELDKNAVKYLDIFCKRKGALKSLIIVPQQADYEWINQENMSKDIKVAHITDNGLSLLYDYYCFDKFFDNIVFTYTTKPEENMLGRVLEETTIDEREAVCLALYHLRYVAEVE